MLLRQLGLQAAAALLVLGACAMREQAATQASCAIHTGADLQDCLDRLPEGARLALPPGRLVLTQPLVLRRRVTLTTAGVARGALRCADDGAGCAVLALAAPAFAGHPVTVAAEGSVLDHLVIQGDRGSPAHEAGCAGPDRPSGGGLAVAARNVTIAGSVIRDVACYSAVVVFQGADGFRFTGNAVLSNGTHDKRGLWSDGLTLLDGVDDVVAGNLFRDNTDVQLVLGGCLRCTVARNRIETTEAPGAAAFAGLLVHGWPHTSGDYDGTSIIANTVDCGPARRCGFGIGVGGRAWYRSPASGGAITGNTVTRAEVGINVDDATGPVTMADNTVTESGGPVRSHCGLWFAGPVNISDASRRFVDPTAGVAMPAEGVTDRSFAGCLPGT